MSCGGETAVMFNATAVAAVGTPAEATPTRRGTPGVSAPRRADVPAPSRVSSSLVGGSGTKPSTAAGRDSPYTSTTTSVVDIVYTQKSPSLSSGTVVSADDELWL